MEIYTYSVLKLIKADVLSQLYAIFIDSGDFHDLSKEKKEHFFRYFVLEYLKRHPNNFYLALSENKILGYLALCPNTLEALKWLPFEYYKVFEDFYREVPGHLHINIDQDERGCGLGTKLLDVAKKEVDFSFSAITDAGHPNNRFYEKNELHLKSERAFKDSSLRLWSSS